MLVWLHLLFAWVRLVNSSEGVNPYACDNCIDNIEFIPLTRENSGVSALPQIGRRAKQLCRMGKSVYLLFFVLLKSNSNEAIRDT